MKHLTVVLMGVLFIEGIAFAQLNSFGLGGNIHSCYFNMDFDGDENYTFVPQTYSLLGVMGLSDNLDIRFKIGYTNAKNFSKWDYNVDTTIYWYYDYEDESSINGFPVEIAFVPYMSIENRIKFGAGTGFGFYYYKIARKQTYHGETDEEPDITVSGLSQFFYITIEAKVNDHLGVYADMSQFVFGHLKMTYDITEESGGAITTLGTHEESVRPFKTGYSLGIVYYYLF